jgi:hypothetical protein
MERRKFLQCANLCGAGIMGVGCAATVQAESSGGAVPKPLTLRPYQLLCTICSMGEEGTGSFKQYEKAKQIREVLKNTPDTPVTVACDAGPMYDYQNSGTKEDTPEGDDFNRKRDLDILQIIGLAPGTTMPARAFFKTVLMGISSVSEICNYETVTGEPWKGCPKAASGNYERGYAKGINALIATRPEAEMEAEKKKSIEAINSASVVTVRPHILVCAVCQYGGGTRPPFKPDNLPELIDIIINKKPDLNIRMAFGADWMICAPCPNRNTKLSACTHVWGNGELDSQLRDLNLLQQLGLKYGSTMKARDLYKLIFEKVTTTNGKPDLCLKYNTQPSVWWDECSGHLYQGVAQYDKGKRELKKMMKLDA